jgi:hypothetical protein
MTTTPYTPPIANDIDSVHEHAIVHARNALLSASIQEYRSLKSTAAPKKKGVVTNDTQKAEDAAFWIGALRDMTH